MPKRTFISCLKLQKSFYISVLLFVGACTTNLKPEVSSKSDAKQLAKETPSELDIALPELPNAELDKDSLSDLLTTHFASYAGDWSTASQHALTSAKAKNDYRLAELATLLAFRAKEFKSAVEAAQIWYELTESDKAKDSWLTALIYDKQEQKFLQLLDADLEQQLAEMSKLHSDTEKADKSDKDVINKEAISKEAIIADHFKRVSGILVNQSNNEMALQVCQHYIDKYPDSAQVWVSSAYVANQFKEFQQAQSWIDSGLALKPDWDLAGQIQASIYQSQGEDEKRLDYIKNFAQVHPKAVRLKALLASELAKQGEYQEALDLINEVIQIDEKDAQAHAYAGSLARKLEQHEQAQAYFETALDLDPSDDQTRWELARYAEKAKDYRQAELYYRDMSQENYQFSAHLRIANLLNETEGVDAAIGVLDKLEAITTNDYISKILTRHYLLMDARRFDDAYGYINEALIYLPENLEFLYSRGLVAAEVKKVEIAENDFRYILSREPEHANALNALGYTLADQTNRFEEAKMLIQKALELEPEQAHILDSMGWVLYKTGDNEAAIEYLQRAYDIEAIADVAAHLGEVFWENGEQQKALEIWSQSYKEDSENVVLVETLKRYKMYDSIKKRFPNADDSSAANKEA